MSEEITVPIKDDQHAYAKKVTVDTSATIGDVADSAAAARGLPTERHYTLKLEGKPDNEAFRRSITFADSGIERTDRLELVRTMLENTDPVVAPPPPPRKKKSTAKKKTTRKKTTGRKSTRKKATSRRPRSKPVATVTLKVADLEPVKNLIGVLADVAGEAAIVHATVVQTFGENSPLVAGLGQALRKLEETAKA